MTATAAMAEVSTFHVTESVSGAPVAGAIIVFAKEGQPGPYEFTTSNETGSFTVDRTWSGPILVLHPSYRPREIAGPRSVMLDPGDSVIPPAAIDPHADIRIYLSSWVGRFDVERLPTLTRLPEFHCGGPDALWDIASPKHSRVVTRDLAHVARPVDEIATMTVRLTVSGRGTNGFAYIAEQPDPKRRESPLARSRVLDSRGEATFEDLPRGRRFAVVAVPADAAPTARFFRTSSAEQSVEIAASPSPISAKATISCKSVLGDVNATAILRLADVPWLPVRVPARLDHNTVRAGNLTAGTASIIVSAPSRRSIRRDALVSANRPAIDLGPMCPPPPFSIAGTVTDTADRSIKNAVIRYGSSSAKSAVNGAFSLHASGPDEASLVVTSDGYLPWHTWFQPSDVPSSLTVRLERGCRYRFRVVDAASREPVRSFRLSCSGGGNGAAPQKLCSEPVVTADGSFTTPPLPASFSLVMIESPGHELFRKPVAPRGGATRLRDLGTFEVVPLSSIVGRVTDDRGRGIAGASVIARSSALPEWDSGLAGVTLFEGSTSAEGDFSLPVAGGTYRVKARASAFADSETTEVMTRGTADSVTLQLKQGCALDVALHPVRKSSAPAVELHRGSADDQSDVVTRAAGDDGRARFEHVAPGDYTLVVRNGRRLAQSEVHVEDGTCPDAVDLTIGSTRVEGVAAMRGEPVANASLSLIPAAMAGTPGLTVIRKTANADGRVTTDEIIGKAAWANATQTDFAGYFVFDDVTPGEYRIVLTRNGDVRSRTLVVGDAAVVEASTDFGERMVPGVVVDAGTSAPIVGAVVTLQNASAAEVDMATSDANGAFTLSDAAGEGLRIVARNEGYETAAAPLDPASPRAVLTMRRATTTADCLILHDGVPVAGALVVWQLENGAAVTNGTAYTSDGGTCELRDVGTGVLTIAAGTSALGITFDRTTVTDQPLNRTIQLGARTLLRAVLPARRIPQDVRFRYAGSDVTQMVWRFSSGTPAMSGQSTWIWSGLAPATLDLALGATARRVTLSEERPIDVSFGN